MPADDSIERHINSAALEYVAGTLRGKERALFEQALADNPQLQAEVSFWEEQLMSMNTAPERLPKSDTWDKIEGQLLPTQAPTAETKTEAAWIKVWQWLAPSVAAALLFFAVLGYNQPSMQQSLPNTDYVAVLTDNTGLATLTALTTADNKNMWLKWENITLKEDTNLQLWAISKRDGETRPIAVFENTSTAQLALDEAEWRLVTDSSFLLLTEEEVGGSAIDEPSEVLLAKGACVRFSEPKT